MRLLSILGLLALVKTPGLCEDNIVRLYTVDDFTNFTEDVNTGQDFSQMTVFLEANLDFSDHGGKMEPIGKDQSTPFSGVFDGQGFALGNIDIAVKGNYAGLFGYTKGATVKNVIFSMSNTIQLISKTPGSVDDTLYGGGLVAYCEGSDDYCYIENSVNIANVTYGGTTNGRVFLGGIAGNIESGYGSHIRNCANYGLVASYGKSKTVDIGGIVGHYSGSTRVILTVNNCLNLGALYFDSRNADSSHAGGIVGHGEYCAFDNCVSAARIILAGEPNLGAIGSLCGTSTYSTFKNCYWNEAAGPISPGTETEECSSYNSSFILSKTITAGNYTGNKLLDALNTAVDYYVLYDYSHWGYTRGKYKIDFTINGRTKHFIPDNQLLLLPGLSPEGMTTFDGWYVDEECTEPLKDYIFEGNLEVFGKWAENTKNYTIRFDMRGGSPQVVPISGRYNTEVTLPNVATKAGCTLGWWENDYGDSYDYWVLTVPAHDVTVHAVWGCTEVRSARDLISLSKVVNSGQSYKSTVVTLENDIVFTDEESKLFEPIGEDTYTFFEGVLDGHGHTVRNLKLRTTLLTYGGLLGYSKGATVRNIVMDASCSVTSTYGTSSSSDDECFFGSLMGYCESFTDNCLIENSVNMATISFEGNTNEEVYVGGLTGHLISKQNYQSSVVNCMNFGTVRHAGMASNYVVIGGLIGGWDSDNKGAFIYNSINYGSLRHDGKSKLPNIGGIAGYDIEKTNHENCVSVGELVTNMASDYIGAITGEIFAGSTIRHCYWNKSIEYEAVGTMESKSDVLHSAGFNTETFELTRPVSVGNYTGRSLIKALNSYVETYSEHNYSRWALNKNRYTVTFVITGRTSAFIALSSQVILLPNLTECHDERFHGWFVDSDHKVPFNSSEIEQNITLYGKFARVGEEGEDDKDEPGYYIVNRIIMLVFVIAAGVVLIFGAIFVIWTRVTPKFRSKKEVHELMEPMLLDAISKSIESLDLYPANYVKPTLKKALISAGIGAAKAKEISVMCYRHADNLKEAKQLPRGVTVDDAAAIAMYTMEEGDLERHPYRLINEALMQGDIESLTPVKDLIYLVMRALRKMPIVYNKPLYRGIRSNVLNVQKAEGDSTSTTPNLDSDNSEKGEDEGDYTKIIISDNNNHSILDKEDSLFRNLESFDDDYLEGEETLWPALASTSTNVTSTKAFLAKRSATGKAEGTLFIIENGWGYNIQSCSMFPCEEEIVMEPERRFRVKTVIPGEGLTIIKMELLRTPLVLPAVFGETKGRITSTSNDQHNNGKGKHGFSANNKWLQRR